VIKKANRSSAVLNSIGRKVSNMYRYRRYFYQICVSKPHYWSADRHDLFTVQQLGRPGWQYVRRADVWALSAQPTHDVVACHLPLLAASGEWDVRLSIRCCSTQDATPSIRPS